MRNKLIAIWHLLRSNDWIVVTDNVNFINAPVDVINRTLFILNDAVNHIEEIQSIMDSAVDEVNEILKQK